MLIFIILLLFIMLYRCKVRVKDFDCEYLSVSNTTATKGIFAVLVMFSHVKSYISFGDNFLDYSYNHITAFLGQTIVALFFFYSGYGIMVGALKKPNYFDNFIESRLFKTLVHFDLAVLLFWMMSELVLKKHISFTRLVGSLIGINSIYNSNWFIFCTLVLYLFVFFSFKLFKAHPSLALLCTTLLTVAYILIAKGDLDYWWYDSVLCLPLGLAYSLYKPKIDNFLQKSNLIYFAFFALFTALFFLVSFQFEKKFSLILAIMKVLFFVAAWVLMTMKITFNNKILEWLGTHSFSIYIIQRLPMTIMARALPIQWNRYTFAAISFALSIVLAYLFSLLLKYFDKVFFPKKKS